MAVGLRSALRIGLLGGLVAWHLSLVGMVETFAARELIGSSISLGLILLLTLMIFCGNLAARKQFAVGSSLLAGAVAGAIIGLALTLLAVLVGALNLRSIFDFATPGLITILKLEQESDLALLFPPLIGAAAGALGAAIHVLPLLWRNVITTALIVTTLIGLLRDVLFSMFQGTPIARLFTNTGLTLIGTLIVFVAVAALAWSMRVLPRLWRNVIITALSVTLLVQLLRQVLFTIFENTPLDLLFTRRGLTLVGTLIVFVLVGVLAWAIQFFWQRRSGAARVGIPEAQGPHFRRWVFLVIGAIYLISFPNWGGPFLSSIAVMVAFYIIMGLGLNLVVGFAGLLDLGYVAFFAIGAYVTAILTSPEMGYNYSYWTALPISMVIAMIAGVILGLPVLRMRGDYLAIATLGFGEIIRILVLSDWLRPIFGGAQGIILIGRPTLPNWPGYKDLEINNAERFFYMVLIGVLIAWFVSVRLRDSRLGRAWMAIREDEDVAQAMGINRVTSKLLAFSIGAFLGGMAGSMFASLLGSVVPRSFELLISINVVALIIVGGMGSLPGVVVGALALVGLPELLREFREYRLLVYGAVLVLMMLYRPEGLWPEARRAAELHEADEQDVADEIPAAVPSDQPPREEGTPPLKLPGS